jgi:hypothetical protein
VGAHVAINVCINLAIGVSTAVRVVVDVDVGTNWSLVLRIDAIDETIDVRVHWVLDAKVIIGCAKESLKSVGRTAVGAGPFGGGIRVLRT